MSDERMQDTEELENDGWTDGLAGRLDNKVESGRSSLENDKSRQMREREALI